jgi:hypothetical protein
MPKSFLSAVLVAALFMVSPTARADDGQGVAQVLITLGGTLLAVGAVDVVAGFALLGAGAAVSQGLNLESAVTLGDQRVDAPAGAAAGILLLLPMTLALTTLGIATGALGAGLIALAVVLRQLLT